MTRSIALAAALLSAAPLSAASASPRYRRAAAPAADAERALYRKECGACHLDFPPSLLSPAAWRGVMAGLERHFGTNAELDPATQERILRWLDAGAGRGRGGGGERERGEREHEEREHGERHRGRGKHDRDGDLRATAPVARAGDPLRITHQPWFLREHRKIDPSVAARPSIKSLANCGACHAGATQWDFDDDGASIPRR